MKYRREIDGLRAVAVIPVILFHAGFQFASGGFVGVDVFFVISGYLITSIIITDLESGSFSFKNFYERRARRILPALFVVVATCIPFAWLWMMPHHMLDFSESLAAVAVFGSNILFWRETGYFDTAAELKPTLHTWSLAVEEQFYIFFPLIVFWVWRIGKRGLAGTFILGIVGSLALSAWGSVNAPAASFFLIPTRAWELLLGALCSLIFPHLAAHNSLTRSKNVAAAAAFAAIICAAVVFDDTTPFPGLSAALPTLGALGVILFATPDTLTGRILSSRFLVGIGLVSYSLYLWHQPVFVFARIWSLEELTFISIVALICATGLLAWITWRWIEQPFRKRGLFVRRQVWQFAAVGSVSLFAFGMVGHGTDGFASREWVRQRPNVVAEIERGRNGRASMVNNGVCHFGIRSEISVESFIDQWDCSAGIGLPRLKKIPLVIAGDSHAADLAMALRTNGLSPLQMSGANCSLVPRRMSADCRKIFENLRNVIADDPTYEYLAITNKFANDELTRAAISEMAAYWKSFNKTVIFLSGMPNYPYLRRKLARGQTPGLDPSIGESSNRKEVLAGLRSMGIHVTDRNSLICEINGCKYRDADGTLLFWDETHFTVEGARRFGAVLLRSDSVFRMVSVNARGAANQLVPVH